MSELLLEPLTPRPHQVAALDAVDDALAADVNYYLIESAMGTGKTLMGAERARSHLERDRDNRVLVLCQRIGLLHYTLDTYARQLGEDVDIGIIGDDRRDMEAEIVIAMMQSMIKPHKGADSLYETIDPEKYSLVVVDEAQHAPAPRYREIIDHLRPEERAGMSGVAYRHDGLSVNELIGPTVYRKTLPESMNEGLLTPVRYHLYSEGLKSVTEVRDLMQTLGSGKLNREIFIPLRDQEAIGIFGKELAQIENPSGLIYCKSIKHADRVAQLMSTMLPYSVKAIHSKLPSALQRSYSEALYTGELQMATVVGMYDEGIDLPRLNFIGILSETASESLWLNRIGRALRLHPGKDFVTVADLTQSMARFRQVDTLRGLLQREAEKTEPARRQQNRNIFPENEFIFSQQVLDLEAEAAGIRKRAAIRQNELNLDEEEHPVPPSIPLALMMPTETGEKQVPLSNFEGTLMAYMFETEDGSMSEATLRQIGRKYFGWAPTAIRDLMDVMEDEGLTSRIATPVLGGNPRKRWFRLTNNVIEGFLKIPSYKAELNDELNFLTVFVEELERKNVAGYKISYHEPEDLQDKYFEVRFHRNAMSFEGVDFTKAEIEGWGSQRSLSSMNSYSSRIRVKQVERLYLDRAETVITVSEGDTQIAVVRRLLTPTQLEGIRLDLKEEYPEIFEQWYKKFQDRTEKSRLRNTA